ncbi:MAG: malonyl CoA-acyl carrier protein transacylase, partial [Deltaproteobacteria bacterium]|nr:malonyl CoA-acyl carrier protein transacylase [Deltaproteobacteria bacterium]
EGVTDIVEIGPGRVLTGLIRRIEPDINTMNLNEAKDIGSVAGLLQGC